MNASILVIDDDVGIRRVLHTSLTARDYQVHAVSTGAEGIDMARTTPPNLVLLDLMLPDMDGRTVCMALRELSAAPILVLSARSAEDDKVTLLDAGANDYIIKPYSTAELLARIRSALRQAPSPAPQSPNAPTIEPGLQYIGDLQIDLNQRQAWVDHTPVPFTPTEWRLLEVLVSSQGRTITYQAICAAVWGEGIIDRLPNLHMYLSQIRAKVAAPGGHLSIINVPQFGYRLE